MKTPRKTPPSTRKMTPKKTPALPPLASPATRGQPTTAMKTPRMPPRRSELATPTNKRKEQKPVKINFNLGRQVEEDDKEDPRGKVKKEKMKIEERLRKEKRDRKLEEIRKPIILTPGSKRRRQEDGEWEQLEGEVGAVAAHTAGGLLQKMKQTPIQTFLVSQTMEDRKSSWNSRYKPRMPATPLRRDTDMSALSASPSLRKTTTKRTGVRKGQEAMQKDNRVGGKVNIIAKYFEPEQKPGQEPNSTLSCKNKDNHNTVCTGAALGPYTTIPSVCSTSPYPEMSSQSGTPNLTTQPMREQPAGHVTKNEDPQPIEGTPTNQHGLGDEGSHLSRQEGPE